jgi:hypothetical protein
MKDLTHTVTKKLIDKIRADELTETDHRELIESLEYMLELHDQKQKERKAKKQL